MSWPRILSGHRDLAVDGKSQLPDYHPQSTANAPYPLVIDIVFGKNSMSGSHLELPITQRHSREWFVCSSSN